MEPLGFTDDEASGSGGWASQPPRASAGLDDDVYRFQLALDGARLSPEALDEEVDTLHPLAISVFQSVEGRYQALYDAGWRDRALFQQAFNGLVDARPAYRLALERYIRADEEDMPSSVDEMMKLSVARRAYIDALAAYRVQLLVVLNY